MPNLNAQQNTIVEAVIASHNNINVVARAGCGKTYVLINGVVLAIVENKLGNVAIMAFNKSASNEFEKRIEALATETKLNDLFAVDSGTVHSFGFRFWRRHAGGRINVDGWKVANIVTQMYGNEKGYYEFASQVQKLVSLAKQAALTPQDLKINGVEIIEHFDIDANGSANEIIEAACMVLIASNNDRQNIDFDDMIYLPVINKVKVDLFDFVLIDEAQDTNAARRELAFMMMKPNGRLIAVGDDKQAIYGFTGANSDSLSIIKQALDSIELPLTITYRCPKAVVSEANRLVPDLIAHDSAPNGKVRTIDAINSESDKFNAWYLEENVTNDDVALCRNTRPLIETAYTMIRNHVACHVEGRDIGEGLIQLATKWKRITTLSALLDKVDEYEAAETDKWSKKQNTFKIQVLEDKCETLRVIANHLIEEGKYDVSDFVSHVRSLFGDTPEGAKPKVFTLSTIHKSKGREWNRVYILRRDLLPSKYAKQDWQLEQENNLEYVAITRAKQELIYVS